MRLGLEVIAVDRYPNAPAMQVAHRAHVIDMLSGEQLRDLVHQENPSLIVPEVEAIATDMLVALEGGRVYRCPHGPRYPASLMNREGIRRLAGRGARG